MADLTVRRWVWAALAAVAAGCAPQPEPQPLAEAEPAVLLEPDAPYSRVRAADGQVTLNDRCPVRRSPLKAELPPLYVNGKPIGFC